MIEQTCCFTGNRPHRLPWGGDETDPACQQFVVELRVQLVRLIALGYKHFICGMALGADTLFAQTVLDLKRSFTTITLEAAVPCPEQPDGWSDADKKRYDMLLAQCDAVTVVSPRYTPGCMMRRNRYMVDKSAAVLAFSRARTGGTAATLRYAAECGKAVIKL